jgi:hypothetical protein
MDDEDKPATTKDFLLGAFIIFLLALVLATLQFELESHSSFHAGRSHPSTPLASH